MNVNVKKYVIPPISALLFGLLYFYLAVPAINLRAAGFWVMLVLCAAFGLGMRVLLMGGNLKELIAAKLAGEQTGKKGKKPFYYADKTGPSKRTVIITLISVGAVVLILVLAIICSSTRLFRADAYQKMLKVEEADFATDIAELPISQIPIVDRDTASRLGSRKIGEVVELVSQFDVGDYYSQINYKGKPYRVSPLEYAGILKWLANRGEGIPYYVTIDMATQETNLVHLDEGMKYSPSEFFGRDLYRHVRMKYPTRMLDELSFEIDEAGHPYWVMPYYNYSFGIFGGRDVMGIILVDAVTGDTEEYTVGEVPTWIDRVYPADLVLKQANNWGSLVNGYFNSIFAQRNVVVTTDGYNYIANDDDVWLYTGITSVATDESNIGFILINMRTKEAKTYMINGAEEYSAMSSAEGQIQEKGYVATFPILINVADRPTYFISLKDNAGLVKAYAFVSVADYQIVGVADTITGAQAEYVRMLGVDVTPEEPPAETTTVSGTVTAVATAVVEGFSVYYIRIEDAVYTASIEVSDYLPFLAAGDAVTLSVKEDGTVVTLSLTP